MVLFDRSVPVPAERVMGFATKDEVEQFFQDVTEFERMLALRIILLKYWFSITDEEQQLRFLMRVHDLMKQWKRHHGSRGPCSPNNSTKAKEDVRAHLDRGSALVHRRRHDKKQRLNCMEHILSKIRMISRTKRSAFRNVFDPDYERRFRRATFRRFTDPKLRSAGHAAESAGDRKPLCLMPPGRRSVSACWIMVCKGALAMACDPV